MRRDVCDVGGCHTVSTRKQLPRIARTPALDQALPPSLPIRVIDGAEGEASSCLVLGALAATRKCENKLGTESMVAALSSIGALPHKRTRRAHVWDRR
jgi:hypothetical protein